MCALLWLPLNWRIASVWYMLYNLYLAQAKSLIKSRLTLKKKKKKESPPGTLRVELITRHLQRNQDCTLRNPPQLDKSSRDTKRHYHLSRQDWLKNGSRQPTPGTLVSCCCCSCRGLESDSQSESVSSTGRFSKPGRLLGPSCEVPRVVGSAGSASVIGERANA